MAAQIPEVVRMQPPRVKSSSELEKSLEELKTQVESAKKQLGSSFLQIHEMSGYREAELMQELNGIPDRLSSKIEERRASLKQLRLNRNETEQQLQANRLVISSKNSWQISKQRLTKLDQKI